MFIGHYGVALAAGRQRIPLYVLFVAAQFLDYIWAILVLLGVEELRVIPGFTVGSPLDAYYMPYSHSLVAAVTWAIGIAAIYWWRVAVSRRDACVLALVILSHWFLDLIAHPPDLALYGNRWKVGFTLWNYRGLEFGVEIALLAGGMLIYLARKAESPRPRWRVVGLALLLVVVQMGDTFVSRAPLTDQMTALGVLVFYTLFATLAYVIERETPA